MQLPEHLKHLINNSEAPARFNLDAQALSFDRLGPPARAVFDCISPAVSTLKPRLARQFLDRLYTHLESFGQTACAPLLFAGAIRLGTRHRVLVLPYLDFFSRISPDLDFIPAFDNLAATIADYDVDIAVTFLKQAVGAQTVFGRDAVLTWGEQGLAALKRGSCIRLAVRAYLEVTGSSEGFALELSRWPFYLLQALRIAEHSALAAESFIRHGVQVCFNLSETETERWVEGGLETFVRKVGVKPQERRAQRDHQVHRKVVEAELVKYFKGVSLKALEHRDALLSGVTLAARTHTLALICEASTGRRAKIRSNKSLTTVKGFTGGAATDGHTLYLPEMVAEFKMFKLMALHQSMLLDLDIWENQDGTDSSWSRRLHLAADQRLLERLPGLLSEMKDLAVTDLPPAYPALEAVELAAPMPWWGDILVELMAETKAIVQELTDKTAAGNDLAAGLIQGLVTSMMADGERDVNVLWSRLQSIFDTVEFFSPEAEELEESFKTFFYKEWDQDMSDYKLDWCLVRQRMVDDEANDFVHELTTRLSGIIRLIRRQFAILKPERFQKFRAQPSGDALDLDALIEAVMDMRSGFFINQDVYIRREKNQRDVAVLFLLDLSASTAEEVAGRRVIDIQKEAVVLMAEALESLDDPYAIYGFTSEGRFRVDMLSVKEFGEPYNDQVRNRIGNLKPKGLTRMGAVIRHAIYKLDGIDAVIKLLVVLTDGRPYDLEYGSFDYAIADTKNAFQEARSHRIHPFIITSDKKGAAYLKEISSQTQSIILRDVGLLPQMLPAIYKRLTS